MKIEVWAHTDIVGDVLELPDDLSEDELDEKVRDYIFDSMEWSWVRTDEA